jgi:hypothetical protein
MFRTASTLALLCCLVVPSLAAGQDLPLQAASNGELLRSGIAAVQRLPATERDAMAAQLQQTKLQSDRKTTVIVVSVVAAATVIYLMYQLHHSGPFVSGHF